MLPGGAMQGHCTLRWLTRLLSQAVGVARAEGGEDVVGGDSAGGVGLHGVMGVDDFFAQPAFDGGVAFLRGGGRP